MRRAPVAIGNRSGAGIDWNPDLNFYHYSSHGSWRSTSYITRLRGFTDRTKARRFARIAVLKGKQAITGRLSYLSAALIYLRLRKLHVSRSIVSRRLAEGERPAPRRRMMPIVLKISGSINRIARMIG